MMQPTLQQLQHVQRKEWMSNGQVEPSRLDSQPCRLVLMQLTATTPPHVAAVVVARSYFHRMTTSVVYDEVGVYE